MNHRSTCARTLTGLLAALALVAAPAIARADDSGPYAILGGMYEHRTPAGETPNTYIDLSNGGGGDAILGYQMGQVGAEVEFSRMLNWTQIVSAPPPIVPAAGQGWVALEFYTVNVRYYLPFFPGRAKVFIGGGVGGYKSYIAGLSSTNIRTTYGSTVSVSATNQGFPFAYQERVGVELPVTNHIDVIADLRFLHGQTPLLFNNTAFGNLDPNGADVQAAELEAKFHL